MTCALDDCEHNPCLGLECRCPLCGCEACVERSERAKTAFTPLLPPDDDDCDGTYRLDDGRAIPLGPYRPPCLCMPAGEVRAMSGWTVRGLGPILSADGRRCLRCWGM